MFVVCTKLANLIEKSIERQRLVWRGRGRGRGPSIITVSAPPQIEAARVTEIQIETAETRVTQLPSQTVVHHLELSQCFPMI